MQNDWQDLLPFYVAGTLNEKDRQRLEALLKESEEVRAALDEWQLIGDFVRSEAALWSRGLPPLSVEVRADVSNSAPATRPNNPPVKITEDVTATSPQNVVNFPIDVDRPSHLRREDAAQLRRGPYIPLTLVASVFVFILFGGLLFATLLRDDGEGDSASSNLASITNSSPIDTPENTPTESDLGILLISPTPTPEPSATPATQTGGGSVQQPSPTWTPPPDDCVAYAGSQATDVYVEARANAQIVSTLPVGEYRRVLVYAPSDGGWYELLGIEGGLMGWVRAADVTLSGPCSDLVAPSPTATGTDMVLGCFVEPLDGIEAMIYQDPSSDAEPVRTIEDFALLDVINSTAADWYRVNYDLVWVGWLNAADASFSAGCNDLPLAAIPTGVATSEEPTATPTRGTPSLQSFNYEANETVLPGDTIRLMWSAENSSRVTIEFYGGDVDPADYGTVAPLAEYTNLLAEGSLNVVIPQRYTQVMAVFVLVMQSPEGSDQRGPTGVVTIPVAQP